jgi:hypothetical protein
VTVLLTAEEQRDLAQLIALLDQAYDHYFANSDGHCKSSEGYVHVDFGLYFDRADGVRRRAVKVYSYCLGPSRTHHFESIKDALAAVEQWHAEEMATDHQAIEDEWDHFDPWGDT